MSADNHLSGDDLEQYCLGSLPEPEIDAAEEHLLTCQECQDRADEVASYVHATRAALEELELHPEPRWRAWARFASRPAPLAAAALILALVAAGAWRLALPPSHAAPAVVVLEASRGSLFAHGPARTPLSLRLGAYGLPESPRYRVQIVDAGGRSVFEGDVTAPAPAGSIAVRTPALRAGIYWVRVYSGVELLREYGLEVRLTRSFNGE